MEINAVTDVINILKSDNYKNLNILPLSYSKVNTIRCPKLFYNKYVIKSPSGIVVEKEPAVVGKFIHKVLQFCLEKGKAFGYHKDTIDFDLTWVQVAKQSSLTQKEYDLAQAQRIHTENILYRLLDLINKNNLSVSTELKFCMDINGNMNNGVKWANRFMYGFIDFFSITPDNFGLVIDFKSFEKSKENSESVLIQTLLYSYFILNKYDRLKSIQPGYIYIPDELFDSSEPITRNDFPDLEKKIIGYFSNFLLELNNGIDNEFTPIEGDYCKWCGYIEKCELHNKKYKGKSKK